MRLINQCRIKLVDQMKLGGIIGGSSSMAGGGSDQEAQDDAGITQGINRGNLQEEHKNWTVEVYKGAAKGEARSEE
jgi:hypothetical protein